MNLLNDQDSGLMHLWKDSKRVEADKVQLRVDPKLDFRERLKNKKNNLLLTVLIRAIIISL